jgi:predicted O-methyltransferase YrrM
VSISAQDADVLRDLVRAERPTTVIEVGLAYGSSALAIAEALLASGSHEARHVIIDAYQDEFRDAGWDAMEEAGLGQLCRLVREKSQTALPRLLSEGFEADAAFVDGSHIFHNVFIDLFYLGELVRPGGLVVIDDYDWPSVATAARYFQLNSGWAMEPIAAPTRLRALRLPIPRLEPSLEDFVPFGRDSNP